MFLFNEKANQSHIDAVSDSAGIFADGISSISDNAVLSLKDKGIDAEYTSKPVSYELLMENDYIFGITQNHTNILKANFPEFSYKIFPFPTDISDPFGCDLNTYKICLDEIEKGTQKIIEVLKSKDAD